MQENPSSNQKYKSIHGVELPIGFLEAWGIRFIINYLHRHPYPVKMNDISKIDPSNVYEPIRSPIQLAVFLSFIVGFVTTFFIVAIELALPQDVVPFSKAFYFKWLIQILSLILFTGLEFYLLYLIGFYFLAKIANYMELIVLDDPDLVTNNKNVLARLILEIPDHRLKLLNIDPYRLVNKHSLLIQTILYKLKVFLSNFFAKLIIRKLLTRSSLRLYADFIIAPITALWDGIVTYIIFKEVKQRLFSRKLSEELLFNILNISNQLDHQLKDSIVRVFANSIVLNHKFHPNLEFLLLKTYTAFQSSIQNEIVLDDWEYFITSLPSQPKGSQQLICKLFNFCCAIDGKFSSLEKKVIQESEILSSEENLTSIHNLKECINNGNLLMARKYISLSDLKFIHSDLVWS